MTYTNVKPYIFVCGRFDDFIIKPSVSMEIKFELHTYWKQENRVSGQSNVCRSRGLVLPYLLEVISHLRNRYFIYKPMLLRSVLPCFLLAGLVLSQSETKAEEVARRENEIRTQNNMTYTNVKSYTFVCGRFDDFIIKPSVSMEIKFELHTYWKQENVYASAEYREGEEIRIIIYEDNQRVLLDRAYHMTTGFSFFGKEGSTYIIRFLAAGGVTKLVSMINSSPIQVSADLATKDHISGAQEKVEQIWNELKSLLTISQRNFLMKEQMSNKILSNTKLYMIYEIFEVVLIIGVAIFQVVYLTRLLKGGSIV